MREKYESLSVTVLREVAKSRGLRHLSGLKKSQLVDLMLKEDEKAASIENEEKTVSSTQEKQAVDGTEEKHDQAQNIEIGKTQGRDQNTESSRTQGKEPKQTAQNVEISKVQEIEQRQEKSTETRQTQGQSPEQKQAQNAEIRQMQDAEKFEGRIQSVKEGRNERTAKTERQERKASKIITSDGIEIDNPELDSGISAHGILEVMPDGYGFIRCENYLPGEHDVYVSPSQIRKFGLKTGDIINGNTRVKTQQEKFSALLYIRSINGCHPSEILRRPNFEDLTPVFPNERIRLETDRSAVAMRIMDVVSPIGKGQRGMIVSPPKAGKTTLLKQVARAVTRNNPDMHLIILLIDERPEEVTDIKEAIEGKNVEVIYSTFDELPEHHKRVSEIGRAHV